MSQKNPQANFHTDFFFSKLFWSYAVSLLYLSKGWCLHVLSSALLQLQEGVTKADFQ